VVNQTFVKTTFPTKSGRADFADRPGRLADRRRLRRREIHDIKMDVPPTAIFPTVKAPRVSPTLPCAQTCPARTRRAVRQAVAAVDLNVPVSGFTTQEEVRDSRIAPERMFATLVGALAGLAVLLACIGLYGLLAYNVARAPPRSASGWHSAPSAATSSARSCARRCSWRGRLGGRRARGDCLAQLVKSQLFGVARPTADADRGALLLLAIALLAAWIPPTRTRVNPTERCALNKV